MSHERPDKYDDELTTFISILISCVKRTFEINLTLRETAYENKNEYLVRFH